MKDIVGYEKIYAITSCGKVWSYITKKFLKPKLDKDGYLLINLYKNKNMKTFKIHRLVAKTYIENPCGLPEVNHKDENKANNSILNLEWCSHKYNQNYGTHNKKIAKSKNKAVYCIELNKVFNSIKSASEELGLNNTCISLACKNKIKTSGGYHWEFYERTLA